MEKKMEKNLFLKKFFFFNRWELILSLQKYLLRPFFNFLKIQHNLWKDFFWILHSKRFNKMVSLNRNALTL